MKENNLVAPADQSQRDLILYDTDVNMIVEAAAGTGKTTGMVGRMVNLLAQGKCAIDTLAAVTFTRKAAGELRSRFQTALENACRTSGPTERARLTRALEGVDRCFIGTIHSFCGRLLRERPVEAGVDIAFQEIDDTQDSLLRRRAWEDYVAQLYADDDAILRELENLGIEIGNLATSFMLFVGYPDVEDWPAPSVDLGNLDREKEKLKAMVDRMEAFSGLLPDDAGSDTLIPRYRRIPLMWRQADPNNLPALMDIFEEFKKAKIVQKNWAKGKPQALEELESWDEFRTDIAEPIVKLWKEKRYAPIMRALKLAKQRYDEYRRRLGVLSYQDLLMTASALLRDKPKVREYFRERFTHLLVDEFQDTDPIQAEVIMLLTADNPLETDWRQCRPIPGSLFVVGDPKQSIYRFRRADILMYNQVKRIISETGGKIVTLSVNFRTGKPLIEWVNTVFQAKFPKQASDYSPQYVNLIPMDAMSSTGIEVTTQYIDIPKEYTRKEDITEYDSSFIAGTVRRMIDSKTPLMRSLKETDAGIDAAARPSDFMIVTFKKEHLGLYGRKLEEAGIPHQVTGGRALNEVYVLSALLRCVAATLNPHDPVALVAALRGDVFGMSDTALLQFKQCGGKFSYLEDVPEGLDPDVATEFQQAFLQLKTCAHRLAEMPPISALERIAADLGLFADAAAGTGGNMQAGCLAKVLEVLRASQTGIWTLAQLLESLAELLAPGAEFDGMPATAGDPGVVRLMNLHKVKGLEAPVVFLADPTGEFHHPPRIFVDRSATQTQGYLRITTSSEGSRSEKELALPRGWDAFEAEEKKFQEAERLRLYYVAATRAGTRLILTKRNYRPDYNPWCFFDNHIADSPRLSHPGKQSPATGDLIDLTDEDVRRAVEDIRAKWSVALSPSYRTAAAKAVSLSTTGTLGSSGEHGTEWGTLMHRLLQIATLNPGIDLSGFAEEHLLELGLDVSRKEEAVSSAHSVMESEIWKRAESSEQLFVEVPFEMTGASDKTEIESLPTLVRGVIDLAFREPQGWVIVDYKTDRRSEQHLPSLVDRYRNQVETYACAWTTITREPVHETGLYFVHTRKYITI